MDRPEDYLYSLKRIGVKLGLDKIESFLSNFDDPHRDFESILVAGTNGKGSVATMISNILIEAGYKTGLYISPHLAYFEERIKVDGKNITEKELWDFIEKVDPVVKRVEEEDEEKRPSFFEVLTALAFLHYSEEDVHTAVLEVGMGGRLDATNVVDNHSSVITVIGKDHAEHLGSSKKEIASEKAGVIKEKNHFVTEEKDGVIRNYFKDICKKRDADYNFALDREYDVLRNPLRLKLPEYGEIEVPGMAEWQAENALTSISLIEGLSEKGYEISKDDIISGLSGTVLPGRMEILSEEPWVMMDSAHNPSGMEALVKALKDIDYERLHLVIGILEDKEYERMAEIMGPGSDWVWVGEARSERRLDSEILARSFERYAPTETFDDGISAVREALEHWRPGDLILITGSIYFIGDVRRDMEDMEGDYDLSSDVSSLR